MDDSKSCEELHRELDQLIIKYAETKFSKGDDLIKRISSQLKQLFYKSERENYFWSHCPFSIYEKQFQTRFKKFKETYLDIPIHKFYMDEACSFNFLNGYFLWVTPFYKQREIQIATDSSTIIPMEIIRPADEILYDNLEASSKAKMNLLNNELKKYVPVYKAVFPHTFEEKDEGLDKMDVEINSKTSLRITYLHELGILEFLSSKYENVSNNQIATLVSKFTGEKPGTLQPAINSILNNNPNAKSYPLSQKNRQKVAQELINLGLTPKL